MAKFSDVVNWLKANATKGEILIADTGTSFARKKILSEVINKENNSLGEKTWSMPNSQNLFTFGNQSSIPSNHDASDDVDGENDLEHPSSPSVKKSEEKGIVVVHEVKSKLYVKSSDPEDKDAWKDKGMGQLSIKCKEGIPKAIKESKPTIIVRNEGNAGGSGGNDSVVASTFLI